jgi:hypothetical protein
VVSNQVLDSIKPEIAEVAPGLLKREPTNKAVLGFGNSGLQQAIQSTVKE